MKHTAHSIAKALRVKLDLAAEASYRAALYVANERGFIHNGFRTAYDLDEEATACSVLAVCATGSGMVRDTEVFLAGARASGVVASLAAALSVPETLGGSEWTFDAVGRGHRVFVDSEDCDGITLAVEQMVGGSPRGRTFTLDGFTLASALAD
jgi:hypothetical protein